MASKDHRHHVTHMRRAGTSSILIVDDIRFAISRGPSMATNVLQVGGHVIGAFHRPKPKPRDRGTGRKCREYLCVTLAPV